MKLALELSYWTILLSGTSSFVCDIDEKTLKKRYKKNKNFTVFGILNIRNPNIAYEKQK